MVNKDYVELALQIRDKAVAPYSKYKVGAVLVCKNGNIYTGANIENVSYSATICAERVALFTAVHAGERDFTQLYVAGSGTHLAFPCGVCRQVLNEFAPSIEIIAINKMGYNKSAKLTDLFPNAFSNLE